MVQHARLFCPSLFPRDGSNSCPLSRCCYLIISSSATPISICPQSFPASGFFPMSQLFASGSRSIAASASTTVFPMNIQGIIFKKKKRRYCPSTLFPRKTEISMLHFICIWYYVKGGQKKRSYISALQSLKKNKKERKKKKKTRHNSNIRVHIPKPLFSALGHAVFLVYISTFLGICNRHLN